MKNQNTITINNSTIVNYTVKTENHEATPEYGAYRTWEVLFTNTENNATAELWLEEGYFDCAEWNDYDENFLGDNQPDFSDDVEGVYGHTHSTLFREQFIKEIFVGKVYETENC